MDLDQLGPSAKDYGCWHLIGRPPGAGSSTTRTKAGPGASLGVVPTGRRARSPRPRRPRLSAQVPRGRPVEWVDLDTWIMGQAKLDGEPTIDVTIALLASALSDPDATSSTSALPWKGFAQLVSPPVGLTTPFQETTGFDAWRSRPMACSIGFGSWPRRLRRPMAGLPRKRASLSSVG